MEYVKNLDIIFKSLGSALFFKPLYSGNDSYNSNF